MTNQHPLTDEICDQIAQYEPDREREDMRIAADWQLEQVIKYLSSAPKLDIETYATYTLITIDIQKAMRPHQLEGNS